MHLYLLHPVWHPPLTDDVQVVCDGCGPSHMRNFRHVLSIVDLVSSARYRAHTGTLKSDLAYTNRGVVVVCEVEHRREVAGNRNGFTITRVRIDRLEWLPIDDRLGLGLRQRRPRRQSDHRPHYRK
jgi:hypothetical protein